MQAKGTYTVSNWDEGPFAEVSGAPKLTRALMVFAYTGDLEGTGTSGCSMFYASDASATFIGYDRIEGTLGGKHGSFVLRTTGTFEDGVARGEWTIVEGSATGDLFGLRGSGGYEARGAQSPYPYHLDYSFDGT